MIWLRKILLKKIKPNKSNLSKGFTLIEVLVVISVIGMMSSTVVSQLQVSTYRSHDNQRISQIDQLTKGLELYYIDYGKYPGNTTAQFMYADSRRPTVLPASGVPYTNLTSKLVPNYLSVIPYPPRNGGKEGAMCGNCDEYFYQATGYGRGYLLCTYLAIDHGGGGFVYGVDGGFYGKNSTAGPWPFYCTSVNCGPATVVGNACTTQ
jgi:prepilin-type N-terminal cleavage/methylation domain-containing protein